MTTKTVDRVIREPATFCDICGGEIVKTEEDKKDPEFAFSLSFSHRRQEKPISETRLVKFRWPSKRRAQEMRDERAARGESEYVKTNWYDFHGECLANLVEAAVALRLKSEAEAEEES